MIFRSTMSIRKEMERMKRIQETDPETFEIMWKNGQLLVELASTGQVGVLRQVGNEMAQDEMLAYFIIKMAQQACLNGHIDVLKYMTDQGLVLSHHPPLRDLLHQVLEKAPPAPSQPLLRFLLDHGLDVNYQRPADHFTALHVACQRQMYEEVCFLVFYGADVNAIAQKDLMPLNCVESSSTTATSSVKDKLIEFLVNHDAQRTWRRPSSSRPPIASFSGMTGIMLDTTT